MNEAFPIKVGIMKYREGQNCASCKFSVTSIGLPGLDIKHRIIVGDGSDLTCHRYPSIPIYGGKRHELIGTGWPTVGKDDWCGEFQKETEQHPNE